MNPFQVLMREWSKLAPYNFIHALRFQAVAEFASWREAVMEVFRPLGFGVPETVETATEITAHLERELNRPFPSSEAPMRCAVVTDGSGFWLTVTFDHWVADDYAGRALLERIVSRSHFQTTSEKPLDRANGSMSLAHWVQSPFIFRRQAADLRRAYRVPLGDPLDFRVRTFHTELPAHALSQIRAFAKRHGATVHDVFLAATAQANGRAFADGLIAPRDCVGIASAMNIRRFDRREACEGFGLNLSQYTVVESRPHEKKLELLVPAIAKKTRVAKSTANHAAIFGATLLLWRLAGSSRQKATTFQRGAPLVAGISNVDLTGSWAERAGILAYRRIGPCGPPVPLVLMITTFQGRIALETTYRVAAFSSDTARGLVADLSARLAEL